MLAGYAHSAGGVLLDPAVPLENANIKINGSVIAYARSIKVSKMSGKIDVIAPYAWLSGTADFNLIGVFWQFPGAEEFPKVKIVE